MPRSKYTKAKGRKICEKLAEGLSLRQICQQIRGLKPSTIVGWLSANKKFGEQYAQARLIGYQVLADMLVDTALDRSRDEPLENGKGGYNNNSTPVQRDRLIIDTIKWQLSKMLPKRYGDEPEGERQEQKKVEPINFYRKPPPESHD